MSKILCAIFGHDDTDATWNSDEPFQTKLYCRRCGWRNRDRTIEEQVASEIESILFLAGLAVLIGLCLWRWIYVIKRMDLQF